MYDHHQKIWQLAYAAKLISTYHDLQIWSTSKCIGIAVKDKIYIWTHFVEKSLCNLSHLLIVVPA